jgi:hypothetical protein
MAATLEGERAERARILAREETQRAVEVAEKRAREGAIIEQRLAGHDAHFALVNGSIDRTAKALEAMKDAVVELTSERKSIVSLQNRQIALVAAVAAILYVVIAILPHP